jgi:hypothetical protein
MSGTSLWSSKDLWYRGFFHIPVFYVFYLEKYLFRSSSC